MQPKTLGEHIQKRRMDLGLFQRQAADKMGVSAASICSWERGTEPELRHIPKIIEFLGYVPFDGPDDLFGRLRYFKKVHGMSFDRLGVAMGRDPEQLVDWLSNGMKPCKRNKEFICSFLKKNSR
ncbi:MAG: helix-turn-helix domain-containing protein [Nitrospirae bacterium]|nr:helix-turn-helix domain-containing protein [Nitrospirota bacterium]